MNSLLAHLARVSLFVAALLAGAAADARTWTSAGGNFKVEAEFVEVKGDKVVLKRPDGQLLEIEVSKLSPADQRFLRGMLKPGPIPADPKPPIKPGPADPAPRPPDASANLTAPPKAELAELQTAIDDYWAALKNHDLAAAEKQLEAARALTLSPADAAVLARLVAHYQVMQQFWSSFQQFAARLPAGGELPVGSEVVAIVESEGGRLVVRALGRNCRFAINNAPTIPAKLAAAVVEKGTKPGGGIVTLFRALGSETSDPDRWKAAAGVLPGANPGVLGGDPRPMLAPKPAGKKLPLPSPADRETAKKQFTELFGKDITAAKTNAQKFELANKWYELAEQTYPQEPATCFVLVNEASDVAGAIGYAVGGHQLAEWLIDRYEIGDPLKVRIAFLLKTGKSVTDPQQAQAAVQWALEVAHEAATAGKFEQMEAIMQVAQASARAAKNKDLLQTVADKKKALDEAQAAEGEMTHVRQTLAANADDPQANHKLGMYMAGVRRSWKDALPYLAKSGEAGVAAAAKLDLANPTDAAKQVEAGDAWWNLAEAAKMGTHHDAYLGRAVYWYQLAVPKLSGLSKIKVEKRLAPKP